MSQPYFEVLTEAQVKALKEQWAKAFAAPVIPFRRGVVRAFDANDLPRDERGGFVMDLRDRCDA